MSKALNPRLRGVDKYKPDYLLGQFPSGFAMELGKELIYLLATRNPPTLEGPDWEQIFARCVGAKWTPSNVGLDDVQLHQMAWSAKTVKNKKPFTVKHIRLISGRNSLDYSFDIENVHTEDPDKLGEMILGIWNARITDVRKKFATTRTVVLIKGEDLSTVSVFVLLSSSLLHAVNTGAVRARATTASTNVLILNFVRDFSRSAKQASLLCSLLIKIFFIVTFLFC